MALLRLLAAALAVSAAALAHTTEDYGAMGPLGVAWPPDRRSSSDEARDAPCGSPDGARERVDFPLSGGSLALEQKDEVYGLQVYISLTEDPQSNDDFELISDAIPALNFSHVCIDAPPLPSSSPQPATLQFRYLAASTSHTHKRHAANETFYACSDVYLVLAGLFTEGRPCFNASAGEHDHDFERPSAGVSSGLKNRVSSRVIVGIVVGCTVGVALVAGASWFFWRRRRRAREVEREAEIARGVAEADAKLRGLGMPEGTPRGSVGGEGAA